jgi:hypothetical protein
MLDGAETLSTGRVESESIVPVVAEEVWAAGVTCQISEEARTEESGMPEIYVDVYDADRMELFLKLTPGLTVGPGEAIGVRGDSEWNVPEPELGVVLYRGISSVTRSETMSPADRSRVPIRCISRKPRSTTDAVRWGRASRPILTIPTISKCRSPSTVERQRCLRDGPRRLRWSGAVRS